MSALPDFGVVVVGTGFIGPVHVEALQRAGMKVLGILGSTPDKTRRACEQLRLETVYKSFEQVLRDPRVGAVHITTPNRLHFEMTAAALCEGKHVMCEKPLAMTSAESAQLVHIAAESGRAAAVAYNIRFYPLCHEAAARRAAGEFGDLLHVSGSYAQDWLLRDTDFNWRVLAQEGGELRAVADIGTHWLDLVQFISGCKVVAVCADLQTVHAVRRRPPAGSNETFTNRDSSPAELTAVPIDTEDSGHVLLQFDNGARGALSVSQVTAGRKNCLRFELAGSRQACAWNSEEPDRLWIGHRERANEELRRDPSLLHPSASHIAQYPGGHCEGFPDTFKQLFRTFYGAIANGTVSGHASLPTFADGHREILLCEAILTSHRQRRWVETGS